MLMGRAKTVTHPDNIIVTNEYFTNSLLKKISGSRTYPVEYTYDAQGRMKTMKTWTNFGSGAGAATTTWNYDQYRGWLSSKRDANSQGCDYTCTAAGRPQARTWARGILLTYTYNNLGEPTLLDHSDSTPDLSYAYDRASHARRSLQDAGGSHRTLFRWRETQ